MGGQRRGDADLLFLLFCWLFLRGWDGEGSEMGKDGWVGFLFHFFILYYLPFIVQFVTVRYVLRFHFVSDSTVIGIYWVQFCCRFTGHIVLSRESSDLSSSMFALFFYLSLMANLIT